MTRPIWTGTLSFGLLNVPVSLMTGERRIDLHFRMLDARDNAPIRYERVNAETGAEVPWKDIVKAFEYDKGSYVVLEAEDIKSAAPQSHESIDIESFVEATVLLPQFFEKPYYLIPGKKAEKGYVLLRETLKKTGRVGIGRVVIRTREYLCAVLPQDDAIVLNLLRYPQELVPMSDYAFPSGGLSAFRISKAEMDMAAQLIESMSSPWQPEHYKDEFRARLGKVIEKRMKRKGVVRPIEEAEAPEDATTNVVDFMALLKKSIQSEKRTPAKSAPAARKAAKRPPAKRAPSTARKTSAARKSTRRSG